ncbi:3052_t:CDS:2, partial [Cetraspora pellucida]
MYKTYLTPFRQKKNEIQMKKTCLQQHQYDLPIPKSLKRIPETWPVKPCQRRSASSINEVLNTYYISKMLIEKYDILMNKTRIERLEQELSKQLKDKDSLEDELKNLIDSYLETLKTWMPKLDKEPSKSEAKKDEYNPCDSHLEPCEF